jgi:hypothetical protein
MILPLKRCGPTLRFALERHHEPAMPKEVRQNLHDWS